MGITTRGIEPGELEEFTRTCFYAFGSQPTDEQVADELMLAEVDRLLVADDGGRLVGTAGAYTFDMTLPGGHQLPVAGVTAVGVLPTHRRQGLLNRMMSVQLDDIVERGEAVAVLTASEASIYGRFGYGFATREAKVVIDTRSGLPLRAEAETGGSLRLVTDAAAHASTVAPVYDRLLRQRVGEISRTAAWWDHLQLDRDRWRDGASARFCVVHDNDEGAPDGYCWYRVLERATDATGARNEVQIWELATADAEIEAALLGYLANLDLTTSISGFRPIDDPWPLRLVDSRRYRVQAVYDHLYVRILDVPVALAARTYEGAGTLVIAVEDAFLPGAGGRFRLEVTGDGTATCERVGERARGKADLRLDAAALGSLYLGDVSPSVLAAAGRLRPSSAVALATADRVFAAGIKPFCTAEF